MFSFCMYCCTTRCTAITIALFSTFMILFAGALIYLDTRLMHSEVWMLMTMPDDENAQNSSSASDIETVRKAVFWGIIALAGSTILIGGLGIVNARFKTCCTIGCYSFLTLFMYIVLGALGALILAVTIASHRQVDQYCLNEYATSNSTTVYTSGGAESQPDYDNFTLNFARYNLNFIRDLDYSTQTLISTYMCTYYCPCVEVNQTQYKNIGKNSTTLSFDGFYSSFYQCYKDLVQDEKITPLSDQMLALIKSLESDYQCMGVCQAPNFFFYGDIRDKGPPGKSCQDGVKQKYDESIGYLAIGLLGTGIIVFIAFNVQYGLWRRRWTRESKKKRQDRSNNYKVDEIME